MAEIDAGFTDADDLSSSNLSQRGRRARFDLAGSSFVDGIQFTFGDETLGQASESSSRPISRRLRFVTAQAFAWLVNMAGRRRNSTALAMAASASPRWPVARTAAELSLTTTPGIQSTDGAGYSLIGLDLTSSDATTWDRPTGWRSSFEVGGSPGERDRMRGDLNDDDRVDLR